jgi:hypothetical protein
LRLGRLSITTLIDSNTIQVKEAKNKSANFGQIAIPSELEVVVEYRIILLVQIYSRRNDGIF